MSPVNIGELATRPADDVVGAFVRRGDVTGQLARMHGAGPEIGEHRPRVVTGLFTQFVEVDAAAVDARRGAGLQAADAQVQIAQAGRQAIGRRIAGPAARMTFQSDVDLAAEKRAHGEDDAAGPEFDAAPGEAAHRASAFDEQVGNLLLEQRQMGLALQHAAYGALVQLTIRLRAGGANRRALARIQGAELDAGFVGGERHGTAQRVDLLDQMALPDPADGRITAHLSERFHVVRQQNRTAAHARGRQGGLCAGMPTAHHQHIVFAGKTHRSETTWIFRRRASYPAVASHRQGTTARSAASKLRGRARCAAARRRPCTQN